MENSGVNPLFGGGSICVFVSTRPIVSSRYFGSEFRVRIVFFLMLNS